MTAEDRASQVWADFNGLFGPILCLSHKDYSTDRAGRKVELSTGMKLTAYMEDLDDDGNPDDLVASGVVEPSPETLRCNGSRWVLRIDENGVRHESEIQK
ncbi:MAG TPA: hypothetical protein VG897_18180 [Terriglobales bacterium]|nr:hypothetical protein [Terriglobales bacterium]